METNLFIIAKYSKQENTPTTNENILGDLEWKGDLSVAFSCLLPKTPYA